MDTNTITNEESSTGINREPKTGDEVFRITVTAEAEKALNELVEKANRNFTGGKVNRTEMASWALVRFNKTIDDTVVQEIRSEYFDEVAALESLWRKAKEKGRVSDEIKQLLLKEIGFEATPKKRQNKP